VRENKLYIRAKDAHEELYDLEVDPAESRDLSKSPQFGDHLVRFRESMRRIDLDAQRLESLRRLSEKNRVARVRGSEPDGGIRHNDL
jgi:hypothetical protein